MQTVKDPGFGYRSQKNRHKIISQNGTFNVLHLNKKFKANDFYTFFMGLKWWRFIFFVLIGYMILNILFATIYMVIGIEEITLSKGNFFDDFLNSFFFSTQTLTTVGYGGITPKGTMANTVAGFESMSGWLYFAVITGLLYGRFSKPSAAITFSDNLILCDYKGGRALMFRLMNSRKTVMIKPKIEVVLGISEKDNPLNNKSDISDQYRRKFYPVTLERDQIMYLPSTWTVVMPIDEENPLYERTNEEITTTDAELFLLIEYHEESFGQKVYQAYSYDFSKLMVNVEYVPSFYFDDHGYTILDHNKLNEVRKIV